MSASHPMSCQSAPPSSSGRFTSQVKTAFAWLTQSDPAKAQAAASKAYEGDGQTSDGERRESTALARQFPDFASLTESEEFEGWCQALYQPLVQAPWQSLSAEEGRS